MSTLKIESKTITKPKKKTTKQQIIKLTPDEFEGKTYYKVIDKDMCNRGFEYKLGLNVLQQDFDVSRECGPGGFYFCDINELPMWIYLHHDGYISEVNLPLNAMVCRFKNKYKSDQIIINNLTKITDFIISHNLIIDWVTRSGSILRYVPIEFKTTDLCALAIKSSASALEYVENQTDDLCKCAIDRKYFALKYVKNQTEEICKYAINISIGALKYVRDQTDNLCKHAINISWRGLKYVKNQTPELCKYALERSYLTLLFITNQTYELCIHALDISYKAIEYVRGQTAEIYVYALKKSRYAINYIQPTHELILEMTEIDKKYASQLIGRMQLLEGSESSQLFILMQSDGLLLEHVIIQSTELCIQAVKQNGLALQFVKNQTPEICYYAVCQNRDALRYVETEFLSTCLSYFSTSGQTNDQINEQMVEQTDEQMNKQTEQINEHKIDGNQMIQLVPIISSVHV